MFFLHICFSYLNVGSFFILSKTWNINCKSKLLCTVSEASILFNNKENSIQCLTTQCVIHVLTSPMCSWGRKCWLQISHCVIVTDTMDCKVYSRKAQSLKIILLFHIFGISPLRPVNKTWRSLWQLKEDIVQHLLRGFIISFKPLLCGTLLCQLLSDDLCAHLVPLGLSQTQGSIKQSLFYWFEKQHIYFIYD